MVATRFAEHLLVGDHASRPVATAVPQGTLYSCTDHTLIYQSDGATWSTWADPSGSVPSLALPTYVATGTSATGTGDVTPALPTGHTADDILLLFIQSDNQAATPPAGYVKVGPFLGIGVAAAAGGTRLTVCWKRDGGSEVAPTVTDTGDHTLAQIVAIRGCPTFGDPFLNVGVTRKVVASTTGTAAPGATPVDNCLVINAFVHALDSASAVFSGWTNADLANVTEIVDVATADGNGGGIGVAYGEKLKAGSFAGTTVTETSTTDASTTFVMLPDGIDSRAGFIDRQVFLTAGVNDTWTRPTAAKRIHATAISGGSSGSAGRNAGTAAGGGGGGGGMFSEVWLDPNTLGASTGTVAVGAGGVATANTDGAASNVGSLSNVTWNSIVLISASGANAAGVSATGSGGLGANGAGFGTTSAAGTDSYGSGPPGGGTGGTTAGAGGRSNGFAGGAGAGGGTSQAASVGGRSIWGAGGGGGGRSNTNVGTGGASGFGGAFAGGAAAGANGTDSTVPDLGGAGAAGGTSAAGPGGTGGWPGGGGGGGGSQSGAQRGGAGGDGVVVITTFC